MSLSINLASSFFFSSKNNPKPSPSNTTTSPFPLRSVDKPARTSTISHQPDPIPPIPELLREIRVDSPKIHRNRIRPLCALHIKRLAQLNHSCLAHDTNTIHPRHHRRLSRRGHDRMDAVRGKSKSFTRFGTGAGLYSELGCGFGWHKLGRILHAQYSAEGVDPEVSSVLAALI